MVSSRICINFIELSRETMPSVTLYSQYASVEKEGEWFMTHEDFVCRYLQLASPRNDLDTIKFIADVADTNKTR